MEKFRKPRIVNKNSSYWKCSHYHPQESCNGESRSKNRSQSRLKELLLDYDDGAASVTNSFCSNHVTAGEPITTSFEKPESVHLSPCGRVTSHQVALQGSAKKEQRTCHTHQLFRLQLVESSNCQWSHCIFGIWGPQHLLQQCLV